MPKLVWFNGTVSPLENAMVPAADHAHLYGDGLFEGIRFYNRRVYQFDGHLDRLYHGMSFMQFEPTMAKSEMRQVILDLLKQADLSDGYIRLNVTRGTGLGLDPRNINRTPNVMIMVNTLALYTPEQVEMGLHVITTHWRVMPPDSLDARLKCIGRYAANIMAKMQANRAGAGEGLMLNQQGYIAECTGDNIFLVQNGVLRTPHPSSGILQGITRDTVIELARKDGLTVTEELLTPFDVFSADEAFLTGTAAEVIPMVNLDSRAIGCGKPGEITLRIMDLFREHTKMGVPF